MRVRFDPLAADDVRRCTRLLVPAGTPCGAIGVYMASYEGGDEIGVLCQACTVEVAEVLSGGVLGRVQ